MFFFRPSISHLCLVVCVDMDIDRSSLDKLAVTISTGIWLHTSMESLVIHMSPPGCESFPTKFANIRPLASVRPLVLFDNTSVNRAEVTIFALKLFFRCLRVSIRHMILELCFVRKSYSTFLTDHWVHLMLSSLVAVKGLRGVTSLGTLITLKNLLLGMYFINMVLFFSLISKVTERGLCKHLELMHKIYDLPFTALVVAKYVFDSVLVFF